MVFFKHRITDWTSTTGSRLVTTVTQSL